MTEKLSEEELLALRSKRVPLQAWRNLRAEFLRIVAPGLRAVDAGAARDAGLL